MSNQRTAFVIEHLHIYTKGSQLMRCKAEISLNSRDRLFSTDDFIEWFILLHVH